MLTLTERDISAMDNLLSYLCPESTDYALMVKLRKYADKANLVNDVELSLNCAEADLQGYLQVLELTFVDSIDINEVEKSLVGIKKLKQSVEEWKEIETAHELEFENQGK